VPVPGDPEFVALDTGIYWAGVYLELQPGRHLARQVIDMAREGLFHVVVLPRVIAEYLRIARREGVELEARAKLQRFFADCPLEPIYEHPLSDAVIKVEEGHYIQVLTHDKDGPIAVEVAHCNPDYFIHSNPEHWSSELDPLLGTQVVGCREFIEKHDVEPVDPENVRSARRRRRYREK
jgi:hypothetical protein